MTLQVNIENAELNGKNYSGEKTLKRAYSLVATAYDGTMREAIVCRIYGSKTGHSERLYASLWVTGHGTQEGASGHGSAGGGGYDKGAAAIDAALSSAGIFIHEDGNTYAYEVSSSGHGTIRAVFTAVAQAFGYAGPMLLVEHG